MLPAFAMFMVGSLCGEAVARPDRKWKQKDVKARNFPFYNSIAEDVSERHISL